MEIHRERTEVVLSGGKPWGFSIKGGTENNKSIIVSKLESGGKGEASGLVIGDIISCVNDVDLAGMRRTQAVELIRKSGDRLILSVERSFPMYSTDMPRKVQSPPNDCYNTDTHIQPATQTRGHSVADQKNWRNSDSSGSHSSGNSANSQKPAGYIFSQSNDKVPKYQHIKETIKSVVIDQKRDAFVGNQSDIIRNRLSDKGRRSTPTAVTQTGEDLGNQQPPVAMRRRHGNTRDTERPRSWHASKHPEIDQGMPSSTEKIQPPPFARRKSREWLETEDLRSTINRKSTDSLLSASSSERLSTSIISNGDSVLTTHPANTQNARDRTSIHSNPSLMEAVEVLARSRPGSMDYDSPYSHHSATERSSQDSLDNMSQKSYCPHSDSKKNQRLEAGNRLRASGRYGEIWKLPHDHQRARSFDALADGSTRLREDGEMNKRQLGASHSDLPSRKIDNSSKSPSHVKPPHTDQTRIFHRGEKGRHVDLLVSNIERGNPVGPVSTNHSENKTNNNNNNASDLHSAEGKSILKRLQEYRSPPPSNGKPKKMDTTKDVEPVKSPTAPSSKYHVQSSVGIRGLNSYTDPDYPTLQSRSDEYRHKIQGMSKKVLRVTSFTRKDLELSPPYQNPAHQQKSFGYPPISEKQWDAYLSSRSISTSSLFETNASSVISIPSTHEEDTVNELPATLSPVHSTVCHVSTSEKLQNPVAPIGEEEVFKEPVGSHTKPLPEVKDPDTPRTKDSHCVTTYQGGHPPPDIINHTNIVMKSPASPTDPDDSYTKIRSPTKVTISTAHLLSTKPLVTSPTPTIQPILPTLPIPKPIPLPIPNIISSAEITTTSVSSVSMFGDSVSSSATSTLPPTCAYYQTSAPKAIIITRLQEKVEGGEIASLDDHNETEEERSHKKIELLKRITQKLNVLFKCKENVKVDLEENEQLGKTVRQHVEELCNARELERFKTFVEEIDKIVNLIFSLSGRLARVENTLATLADDAHTDERNGLLEKKRKLSSQLEEANLLKDNVNKRQETVCKTLSTYMNREQYNLFEHYIKMKTTLISEQRDIDDKMKLGEEQMRELYDSLPSSLQDEHPQYQTFLPSNFTDRN